jgi:hypothetical protein
MERVEHVVRTGNARHRVKVAQRLEREGVRKGKAHSLLSLARNRLKFDAAVPPPGASYLDAANGAADRLLELLERLSQNALVANPELAWSAAAPCCGRSLVCPQHEGNAPERRADDEPDAQE